MVNVWFLVILNVTLSRFIMFLNKGSGVPWDQIMENEFEYLSDRGGHVGHSEKQEFQRNKNFKFMLLLHEIPKLQGNSIFNV